MSVTKQIALIRFYGLFNISGLSLVILLKSWNLNRVPLTLCSFFARNSFQILWWNMAKGWNIYFGKFHPETKFFFGMVERRKFWGSYPILKDDALKSIIIIIIMAWTKIMIILSIIYWGLTLCRALCWVLYMPYFFSITLWVKL